MSDKIYYATYACATDVTLEESKSLASNEAVIGATVELFFLTAAQCDRTYETKNANVADLGAYDEELSDESSAVDDATTAIDVDLILTGKSRRTQEPATPQKKVYQPGEMPVVEVHSRRGYPLGRFDMATSLKLARLRDEGFTCKACLSAVAYAQDDGFFWGEFALICYAPSADNPAQTWEHFFSNTAARIANGAHPDLALTKKGLTLVLESDGAWCEMKSLPYDKLDRGAAYFKKRRSPSDSLVDMAVSGKTGCKIVAWVFFILLVLGAAYFIWHWIAG